MGTGASNGHCSDPMTLPINDWLFCLECRTIPPYCVLLFLSFIRSEPSDQAQCIIGVDVSILVDQF